MGAGAPRGKVPSPVAGRCSIGKAEATVSDRTGGPG